MKKKIAVLTALSAAAVLVGCASPAPVPVNFQLSHQKVARTAHHWDVVADDVVTETLRAIVETPQLQGRGVYIARASDTAFNNAFREFMITGMVNRGARVSVCRTPEGKAGFSPEAPDIEITYDVQHVTHRADLPRYQPPRWTLLAAGVAVLRNVFLDGHETAGVIGGIAAAELGVGHLANAPQTEIIVTTTIAENNRFVARKSDIYYVPEADAALFIRRVGYRSPCPGEAPIAAAASESAITEAERELDRREREQARKKLVDQWQERTNPNWRRPAVFSN